MSSQQGGVAGWLGSVLRRAETTHQPVPAGNIVTIPNAATKLCDAIDELTMKETSLHDMRASFDEAWQAAHAEYSAAVDKNSMDLRDVQQRLYKLRTMLAEVVEARGVSARVDQPPQAVFSGGEGEPE